MNSPESLQGLLDQCRETLLICSEVQSNDRLRTLFSSPKIKVFQTHLQEEGELNARLDALLAYLQEHHNSQGESALALFLEVLVLKYEKGHRVHEVISSLAEQFHNILDKKLSNPSPDGELHPPGWLLVDKPERLPYNKGLKSEQSNIVQDVNQPISSFTDTQAIPIIEWLGKIEQYFSKVGASHQAASEQEFFASIDKALADFGKQNMNTIIPNRPSSAAVLFSTTAQAISYHMRSLETTRNRWAHLRIGDHITDQTIETLSRIETQMVLIDRVLNYGSPPDQIRRIQHERNELALSAKGLRSIFEQLDGYLASGHIPDEVLQAIKHYYGDLTYYSEVCITWLAELAGKANRPIKPILQ